MGLPGWAWLIIASIAIITIYLVTSNTYNYSVWKKQEKAKLSKK
ncbi:hypothetical protein [Williamsoniiplasma somnilux]|nr:hypothetical protein [Williamsoniiplasma somnilux]